ncbi:uncharacterized protein LOC133663158 [Entelurus aequoreus]|uniref:uncharacterized protein LOC133663158 n=1 Tax=Entelurus aequoreus TaxID=161455 RepID=UPI002B1E27A8|nr:uncharacterized protein LOC133663158 [Entelurus aequoreus]
MREKVGSGHDALRESLKNKFKKERRPLIGDSMVQQMRAKFAVAGSGRKRSFPGQPSQLLHINRPTAQESEECREDERRIEAHINEMSTEMLKLLWEMKEQFLVEADRRMVTELDRMATKMVQRASVCDLKDCCQRAINACLDDSVRRGLIRDAAILLLPSIFREDSSFLYTLLEEPNVPTPAIMLHNTHEGNPLQVQRITLYLDGIQVLTEGSSMDISYAMSALMSLYFVFAVQYPKELRKTYFH